MASLVCAVTHCEIIENNILHPSPQINDYHNLVELLPHVLGKLQLDANQANMSQEVLCYFDEWVTAVNRYFYLYLLQMCY